MFPPVDHEVLLFLMSFRVYSTSQSNRSESRRLLGLETVFKGPSRGSSFFRRLKGPGKGSCKNFHRSVHRIGHKIRDVCKPPGPLRHPDRRGWGRVKSKGRTFSVGDHLHVVRILDLLLLAHPDHQGAHQKAGNFLEGLEQIREAGGIKGGLIALYSHDQVAIFQPQFQSGFGNAVRSEDGFGRS